MLFATDLDRTLIYSKTFIEGVDCISCIEVKADGTEVAYMTNSAIRKLKTLMAHGLQIIPVTTRSVTQYKRIKLSQNFEYAITTNGGTILHNGDIFQPWEDYIQKNHVLSEQQYQDMAKLITQLPTIVKPATIVDGKFVFAKTDDVVSCNTHLSQVVNRDIWHYTIQGRKVYIIPKGITKGNALNYLVKHLGITQTIAAGDGKLDVDFLKVANYKITPLHGEIYQNQLLKDTQTYCVGQGITAADDILALVEKLLT